MLKPKPFYLEKLLSTFDERKIRNRGYSLRSFARDLEISPSNLSNILNNLRGISTVRARKLASQLKLDLLETEAFVNSVALEHGRSERIRNAAEQNLKQVQQAQSNRHRISESAFESVGEWQNFAILELLELSDCQHNAKWFADRLSLPEETVETALARMQELGLIAFQDGIYKATSVETITDVDKPSADIKDYHTEILEKGKEALNTESVDEREFTSMILAFSSGSINGAKQAIREFQSRFAQQFYTDEHPKDSVFQLSIQFFRLDRSGKPQ